MKFVVSSIELFSHMQSISKVINPKNTLPILDNFLFKLEGNNLEITASDLETTMITSIQLENVMETGVIAIPSKLMLDTLKEFPEQPLTFNVDTNSMKITISSENGQFTLAGHDGNDFPQVPSIKANSTSVTMPAEALSKGITRTIFATSDDELRPIMNGILFEFTSKSVVFVASDAQKLVKYERTDVTGSAESQFVLPKKPANLLKGVLSKENGQVKLDFDSKNAVFTLSGYKLVCRLAEGQFPSYNAVIPQDNPNTMTVDRAELSNAIRRVSVFSNPASNLIKLMIKGNELVLSAQDIDFSISAYERLRVNYEGTDIEIGFKSVFLIELLSNISTSEILLELSDPSRAGLIKPINTEDTKENIIMLLMPMMINA